MTDEQRVGWPSQKEADVMRMLIARGDSYGLDLVNASEGKLKRGTIYVLLDRMEDKGLIESWTEDCPTDGYVGIPRRRYRLTGAGIRALRALELGEAIVSKAWAT